MEITYSEEFQEDYRKIKDGSLRAKILKQIKKLEENPDSVKPLMYELKGNRSLRVHPFRIIYRIEQDKVIVLCFEHRKDVYR